ncbi:MAG: zinc-ribbon domain-containing protein [Candidatus Sifarchaeia archaeon]
MSRDCQSIISLQIRYSPESEMIHTGTCPKCGSNRIAGPHKVAGQHYVRIDLPGFSTATLESFTCADCGYTEFYSDQVGLRNINTSGRFVLSQQQTYSDPYLESPPPRRMCPYCGTQLRPGSLTCHECGHILS